MLCFCVVCFVLSTYIEKSSTQSFLSWYSCISVYQLTANKNKINLGDEERKKKRIEHSKRSVL